jgi:hypothetical protein
MLSVEDAERSSFPVKPLVPPSWRTYRNDWIFPRPFVNKWREPPERWAVKTVW